MYLLKCNLLFSRALFVVCSSVTPNWLLIAVQYSTTILAIGSQNETQSLVSWILIQSITYSQLDEQCLPFHIYLFIRFEHCCGLRKAWNIRRAHFVESSSSRRHQFSLIHHAKSDQVQYADSIDWLAECAALSLRVNGREWAILYRIRSCLRSYMQTDSYILSKTTIASYVSTNSYWKSTRRVRNALNL